MEYYVEDKKIEIDAGKMIGIGREGKVYRIGDYVYKVYYSDLMEKLGEEKLFNHQKLLSVDTEQIVLPDALIYDEDSRYVGYRAPFVSGKNNGVIFLESSKFVKNLKILEKDTTLLSKNRFVLNDVVPANFIYDSSTGLMYIIDPGKYKYNILGDNEKNKDHIYIECNFKIYDRFVARLIKGDLIKYNSIGEMEEINSLLQYIKYRKGDLTYSEFFDKVLIGYGNVDEYVKSLVKYIK